MAIPVLICAAIGLPERCGHGGPPLQNMKRCPQCNRVESDEALKFCRVDGATLVSDSSAIDNEAGTVRLDSGAVSSEVATNQLPSSTNAEFNRATGPTTVLPSQLSTKTRLNPKALAVIGTAIIAAVTAVLVISYRNRSNRASIQSIAVMPFVNASGNGELDYLSDGITETLIRSLSQLPNLSVKSRSTVFTYKGKQPTPNSIGQELGVQAVLLGRVVQRGDALSLSLELVNTQTQDVIWTDEYERRSSDLISLQNEIARDVSGKLKLKLSGDDQRKLATNYTNDPEAYRLYLQARFYLNKRVGKQYEQAESYLKASIAKDPNFALGYAGLAEFIGERDRPKAKEYIMRAIALDNQLSDAHSALGYQLMLDYDFAASGQELERAIALDPKNARAYQHNAVRLMMIGKYDESLASFDRAIEIEPTLPDIRNNRAACLVAAGKLDEAIASNRETMKMDPTFPWTYSHISYLYRMKGDHAASVEARATANDLLEMPENAKKLRESFAAGGWTAYLRELLSQDWGKLGTSRTRRASLLAEVGEKEQAIAILTSAAETGDWWLFSIKYDPAFDSLRGDPRFQELLKKFSPPK